MTIKVNKNLKKRIFKKSFNFSPHESTIYLFYCAVFVVDKYAH